MAFDVIIAGGFVIDGTGHPGLKRDIGVRRGRVAALAPDLSGAEAGTRLDATGCVVCPGFIDIHSHADRTLYHQPRGESALRQGITTVLGGQCGSSAAPVNPATRQRWRERGVEVPWNGMGEYLAALAARGIGVNFGCLVGQGTVRGLVVGAEARPATADELRSMQEEVRQAIVDGAFGLSSGRRYLPGCLAPDAEVFELCRAVTPLGGIYASHVKNQDALILDSILELVNAGRVSGVTPHLAHHKVCGKPNWGGAQATLALLEAARNEGIDLLSDLYPYPYTQITPVGALFPRWVTEGGTTQAMDRLRDEASRQRLRAELEAARQEDPARFTSLVETGVLWCAATSEHEGRSCREVACALGTDVFGAWIELFWANEGQVKTAGIMSEADIRSLLVHKTTMLGTDSACIDGLPTADLTTHPRTFGTYPYVLQRYVRDLGLLSWEQAIMKMTSMPARRLGLDDRGCLRPGSWADITVFDPGCIADLATITGPARYPEGIRYVLVNGTLAVDGPQVTGALSGQVLHFSPKEGN